MTAAIALDLGSTSIKAAMVDRQGVLQHLVTKPAPEMNVHEGRYECSALDYVEIVEQVLNACLAHSAEKPPLGLCSQRSSFLIWNKTSGTPLTPLISWQDDRGMSSCERLHAHTQTIRALTGLQLTPYYFAPKLSALLQENPTWREKLSTHEWLAGTLDTFLIWRWSGKQQFITDASMAARTLLMDIHTQQWSEELCNMFGIPRAILPRIVPSTELNLPLDNGLTLQASVGDQSAALIASLADNRSEALVNLGTGGFVIRALAQNESAFDGYLQTLVYRSGEHPTQFAIEGTLNSIALALAGYPTGECEFTDLATNRIFCLAEPSGLGAPYFRPDWGIHFSESVTTLTRQQIAALLLEAIVFRVARILEEFHRHTPLTGIYLSGGLSGLACLQQGIAQCTNIPVYHLQQQETSLQGAAILASGFKLTIQRHAQPIVIRHPNTTLTEKYRDWKIWLDGLLK